ncbi:branched-chain amino acid ABC transporter permease [Nitriliruptor alkaliphilus]|uniref:branched-chain amino acid ABC transporter permease n=1 Tax=Nitriliruptor alkaliphilus TaxID=427918 RepID=UPI0006987DA9|nr:branched-chain amino acid ABC transporter permease [Nitriliruptor alkaliphilus]
MSLYLSQFLHAWAYASILYLLAVGLSLTFGVGRVLNLAHGGFYMFGGYLGYSVIQRFDNFWLALLIAPLGAMAVALVAERLIMRRFYGHGMELHQILLTFGLAFVISDAIREYWGARILTVGAPELLRGTVDFGLFIFPRYRLFVIGVGIVIAFALWGLIRYSDAGVKIRAAAADGQIAETLGVHTTRVLALTFVAGVGLAAFGGVIASPMLALAQGVDFQMLIMALIVVVIAGLGKLETVYWAALIVALVDIFGRLFVPRAAIFLVFSLMALVLAFRPTGLFTSRSA